MRADIAALTDATPWIKKAPPRRYKPDGRPVTTRIHASKQLSHTDVWNRHTFKNSQLSKDDRLLEWKFTHDRIAARQYRFVLRNGELTRVQ